MSPANSEGEWPDQAVRMVFSVSKETFVKEKTGPMADSSSYSTSASSSRGLECSCNPQIYPNDLEHIPETSLSLRWLYG
jgi:hypothetical protein